MTNEKTIPHPDAFANIERKAREETDHLRDRTRFDVWRDVARLYALARAIDHTEADAALASIMGTLDAVRTTAFEIDCAFTDLVSEAETEIASCRGDTQTLEKKVAELEAPIPYSVRVPRSQRAPVSKKPATVRRLSRVA